MFLHGHYKQIDCICNIFNATLDLIYMYKHGNDLSCYLYLVFFFQWLEVVSLHQRLILLLNHQKYYCDVNLLWNIAIIIKLKTCYKSEKWNLVFKEDKWRLHMCPLKNFDTRWYYNIHKLSQKNYLKFFGFPKTTSIDNYGRIQ